MSRRGAVALTVLVAWVVGLGLLARRQLMKPESERLAEAAMNVQPSAAYFAVLQGGEQIGYASARVDTMPAGFRVLYTSTADVPVGGKLQRASVISNVSLTRRFTVSGFELEVRWPGGTFRMNGVPRGDSAITLLTATGADAPDTLELRTAGRLLFPTVVPIAIALARTPQVGDVREASVFDPTAMGRRELRMRVAAESTFVLSDSSVFDAGSKRWRGAIPAPTKAWKLVAADSGVGSVAWVDDAGQLVRFEYPGGFVLDRRPYEVAYENWRAESLDRPRTVTADRDILESTAIAASRTLRTKAYERMRVRLSGTSLAGFDLAGGRQAFAGGVLAVAREDSAATRPAYALPLGAADRARFRLELAAEPLVQSGRPEIVALSRTIVGGERDPRAASQLLARWVHDSLKKEITFGLPDAAQVLRTRQGDCNEHTALFMALARAAGIPTRSAAGLAYVTGKFYYHAWPEVWLGRWVAVDPTFGEYPADASHLRFVIGGLDRQAALLRLIGALKIDVVSAR